MKKQKIILLVFAVLAFIGLGIGYAALTDTLTLTATVSGTGVNADDNDVQDSAAFDIQWVSHETPVITGNTATRDKLITFESPLPNIGEDTAEFTVSNLCVKGDAVQVVFNIKNTSEYAANLALKIDETAKANATANNVEISATLGTATLAAGASTTVTVNVELLETLFSGTYTCQIPITIVATAQDPQA